MLASPSRITLGSAATLALVAAFATSPVLGTDGVATLGSPAPEEDAGSTATVSEDPMDDLLDYAACMRESGIDMPDPQLGGGGFVMEIEATPAGSGDQAAMGDLEDMMSNAFTAADEACSHHLGAMDSDFDPALEAELMEQMLAHTDCMREHGIDMPDPDVSGGAISLVIEFDPFSDDFMAAEEACRDVFPFGEDGFGISGVSG